MTSTQPKFRPARAEDLPALVVLLADDILGATREKPDLPLDPRYGDAFAAIAEDPNQCLVVAEVEGTVIGTLHLRILPGLARLGASKGQIDAVRVARPYRGQGLGEALIRWAVEECRRRGCVLVQLTSDNARVDAHRFYDRLGFQATHVGYKLPL